MRKCAEIQCVGHTHTKTPRRSFLRNTQKTTREQAFNKQMPKPKLQHYFKHIIYSTRASIQQQTSKPNLGTLLQKRTRNDTRARIHSFNKHLKKRTNCHEPRIQKRVYELGFVVLEPDSNSTCWGRASAFSSMPSHLSLWRRRRTTTTNQAAPAAATTPSTIKLPVTTPPPPLPLLLRPESAGRNRVVRLGGRGKEQKLKPCPSIAAASSLRVTVLDVRCDYLVRAGSFFAQWLL